MRPLGFSRPMTKRLLGATAAIAIMLAAAPTHAVTIDWVYVGNPGNPAGVRRQVIGVADRERVAPVADALRRLGVDHALVVHGAAGLDEIAPLGPTLVSEVRNGETREWRIDPAAHGLEYGDLHALRGGEPQHDRVPRPSVPRRGPAHRTVW